MSNGPVVHGPALVVGLGLIGGSLAAALRTSRFTGEVRGFDADGASAAQALALGLVDSVATTLADGLRDAALVVIAVPTLAVEDILVAVRDAAPASVMVTDVASVKGSVLAAGMRVFGHLPPGLVPGHPIAGSERSGVTAADAGLFRGHRVILTPHAHSSDEAVACVRQMWERAGAVVSCMDALEHDRVLALTSHLPHMLAFTLVNVLSQQDASEQIFRFAAGGFRDFTRIASSDPLMWRDIALANRVALLDAIDAFSRGLANLRAEVTSGDGDMLHADFAAARGARGRYLRMLAAGEQPSPMGAGAAE